MQVSFDASQLARERQRDTSRESRQRVWVKVRAVSFDAERGIKLRMPVDTGRARGSWGHSFPPALPSEGIWQEDEANLAITQGSRVEYIEQLNAGSSRQAPAGFIDAEERRALNALEAALASELENLF